MASQGRLALHEELCEALGSRYVYFRPTDHTTLHYPCIIYERVNNNTRYADNAPYHIHDRYEVIVVDEDPDSEIVDRVARLPFSLYSRHYYADGLNHDVFTIYHI